MFSQQLFDALLTLGPLFQVLALTTATTTSAIQCYVCNSLTNGQADCADTFTRNSAYLTTCSSSFPICTVSRNFQLFSPRLREVLTVELLFRNTPTRTTGSTLGHAITSAFPTRQGATPTPAAIHPGAISPKGTSSPIAFWRFSRWPPPSLVSS